MLGKVRNILDTETSHLFILCLVRFHHYSSVVDWRQRRLSGVFSNDNVAIINDSPDRTVQKGVQKAIPTIFCLIFLLYFVAVNLSIKYTLRISCHLYEQCAFATNFTLHCLRSISSTRLRYTVTCLCPKPYSLDKTLQLANHQCKCNIYGNRVDRQRTFVFRDKLKV